jgi:polysaccharide biosynthesis/export protein
MRNPAALFTARRFAMRDKDILFVSNAPLTEVGKAFQLVSMLTQPAIQGAAVGTAVK